MRLDPQTFTHPPPPPPNTTHSFGQFHRGKCINYMFMSACSHKASPECISRTQETASVYASHCKNPQALHRRKLSRKQATAAATPKAHIYTVHCIICLWYVCVCERISDQCTHKPTERISIICIFIYGSVFVLECFARIVIDAVSLCFYSLRGATFCKPPLVLCFFCLFLCICSHFVRVALALSSCE